MYQSQISQMQNDMQKKMQLKMMQQKQLEQQKLLQRQHPNFRTHQEDINRTNFPYNNNNHNNSQRFINQNYQQQQEEEESDSDDDEEEIVKLYQENQHFIVISSLDRNWLGNDPNTTQYNFQLKFSPTGNSISNKNLYENNPTILATLEQATQGLRGDPNTSGWTYEGTSYPIYRADLPLGEIIGYEKIIEQGQKGLSLNNSFKNIVSLELMGAMMPSVQRQVSYHPTLRENTIDETYYTMEIDEIKDVMNGSSRDLNNTFAVLIPFIRVYDIINASSKTVEYKVGGLWSKRFSPAPLSSLTNLSIQMKKPSGDLLKNLNDTLDIKFVYHYQENMADSRTDVLIIQTTQYFSENEYKATDTIIIKNYKHYNSTTPESQDFNDFMNQQKGHKILASSSSDTSKFLKNRIHIARPAYLDINTGGLTDESWYPTFRDNILDDETTIDDITIFDTGRLINIDLQNVYFFKITTKEQNMTLETDRV